MGELKLTYSRDYEDKDLLDSTEDYGDGDYEDGEGASVVTIREVSNGYIVEESYEEGDEVYVFSSSQDLLHHLKKLYGAL